MTDPALVEDYRALVARQEGIDEFVTPYGVHPGNDDLHHALLATGVDGLRQAAHAAALHVRTDGITYGLSAAGTQANDWRVDPIPLVLSAEEWSRIERGLTQRARLLRAVHRDIYGPKRLLRSGSLPAGVVMGHPGFVREADGITPDRLPLQFSATDLGRDESGGWRVLGDRAQAPSGSGYAMANRRIVSRLLPALRRSSDVMRLRPFFNAQALGLQRLARLEDDVATIALMSPGPASETAYDQALVASILGINLVEADDLVVEDGVVRMRTDAGRVDLDVILRRVDEHDVDPLDLRSESRLGVPGLLESARSGHTIIANAVGTGVLESAALPAFLPRLCEELLGEELEIPSIETHWCGTPEGLDYVRAHFDELYLCPVDRALGAPTRTGAELDADAKWDLLLRVERRPWAWVGQRPVSLSTTPVGTVSGLEPRRTVFRAFGTWVDEEHVVMPGGLARAAGATDTSAISNSDGAVAKDVWVLEGAEPDWKLGISPRVVLRQRKLEPALPPRLAENLFWYGRYLERAEQTTRLLTVVDSVVDDSRTGPSSPGGAVTGSLLAAAATLTGVPGWTNDDRPRPYLYRLLAGPMSGTVASSVGRLVTAAQNVREVLSGDTWPILARLERLRGEAVDAGPDTDERIADLGSQLSEPLLALAGTIAHGMVRDSSWAFVDAGMRLERAQWMTHLLATTLSPAQSPTVEFLVTEAVLRVGDSTITHRRRVSSGQGPSGLIDSTLDLLLLDTLNPRAVGFQIIRLARDLRAVGDSVNAERFDAIMEAARDIELETLVDDRGTLASTLTRLRTELRSVSEDLTERHFRRQSTRRSIQVGWSGSRRPGGQR